jgi:hypothetical protein
LVKDGEDFHDVAVVRGVDRELKAPRKNAASLQQNRGIS